MEIGEPGAEMFKTKTKKNEENETKCIRQKINGTETRTKRIC